jgi:hypothetical protein
MKQLRTLLMRAFILASLLLALNASIVSADPGDLAPGAGATAQAVIPEDPGIEFVPDQLPEDPGIN